MKRITLRKIVLASIAAFAGVMLLIGLCFTVVGYSLGMNGSAERAVGLTANGFDMLKFKFPTVLKMLMIELYRKEAFYSVFGVVFGIFSVLTLIVSIGSFIVNVMSIFLFDEKKSAYFATLSTIISTVLSGLYAIVTIVFVIILNSSIDTYASMEIMEELSELGVSTDFSTSAFVSIIFQGLILAAYIVCNKTITEKQGVCPAANTLTTEKAGKGKNAAEQNVCPADKLMNALEGEKSAIKLLLEYKSLYDNAVLSSSDYTDKKVALFRFVKQRLHTELSALVSQCSIADAVKAETQILLILKDYKQLFADGVISGADFADKKGDLLSSIIS